MHNIECQRLCLQKVGVMEGLSATYDYLHLLQCKIKARSKGCRYDK